VEFRGYARQFQPQWIDSERRIARFVRDKHGRIPRWAGTQIGRWFLLGRTLFARPKRRFDSVRIWARPRASAAGPPRSKAPRTFGASASRRRSLFRAARRDLG
jgi:hypothetical protein